MVAPDTNVEAPKESRGPASVRDGSLNFVREYTISDVSVCDKLIELFKTARSLGLTGPGRTGRFEVNKKVKDSEDLAVEQLPQNNPKIPSPKDSGYDSVMRQFMEFIPRYYRDVDASWPQPVEFRNLPHFQYYKPGAGYHAWHCDAFGDVVSGAVVDLDDDPEAAGALHERRDGGLAVLADHQVALPVPGDVAPVGFGRALGDVDHPGDRPAPAGTRRPCARLAAFLAQIGRAHV